MLFKYRGKKKKEYHSHGFIKNAWTSKNYRISKKAIININPKP